MQGCWEIAFSRSWVPILSSKVPAVQAALDSKHEILCGPSPGRSLTYLTSDVLESQSAQSHVRSVLQYWVLYMWLCRLWLHNSIALRIACQISSSAWARRLILKTSRLELLSQSISWPKKRKDYLTGPTPKNKIEKNMLFRNMQTATQAVSWCRLKGGTGRLQPNTSGYNLCTWSYSLPWTIVIG